MNWGKTEAMRPPLGLEELHGMIRSRVQLLTNGSTERSIRADLHRGQLVRPWHGCYVSAIGWQKLTTHQQHIIRALCAEKLASKPVIFSHLTAAAILGLPLLNFEATRVHTLQTRTDSTPSDHRVIRHSLDFLESDLDHRNGRTHTNLVRTVVDIARHSRFEQGVVVGDAALHRAARQGAAAAEALRSSCLERLHSMPGTRGHRRAHNVLRFLDAGAESPLESLYRLQFSRLGFEVRTQVPVPGPRGSTYRMDLELLGECIFFEADGQVKYTDAAMRNGKDLEQILLEERNREAWVRSRVSHRVLRGGWLPAQSPEAAAALLGEYRVVPPVDRGKRCPPELH